MNHCLQFQQNKYSGWKMDLRESRLKKVAQFIKTYRPGKMLDAGCSAGDFSAQFINSGWQVYGVDISPAKVNHACKRGLIAIVADIEDKLPYQRNYFDLIFAGELIEHLFDTTHFLKECHRILKPNAKLIITTPNIASLENRIRIVLGKQPIWVDYKAELSSGHIRAYTFSALKEQLEGIGFSIEVRLGGFVSPAQLIWNDINTPFLKFLGDWFPSLAQDMIVVARKITKIS
jgi:SAM-dependent methyltransferase